jgi:diaminopimelate decarboxylase
LLPLPNAGSPPDPARSVEAVVGATCRRFDFGEQVALPISVHPIARDPWERLVAAAAREIGTPCYVARWTPVADALAALERLQRPGIRIRSWLSLKTHPVMPLLDRWIATGRGVEVVSECEFVTARRLNISTDWLLVNGVAKHAWLGRHAVRRLRVHFDSPAEMTALLPAALAGQWRVGVRCHAPDESDARDPRFGGQFGMTVSEAVAALRGLIANGADVHGVHFHLGQTRQGADVLKRSVRHVADVCAAAGFRPRYVDLGGGLPTGARAGAALDDLNRAIDLAMQLLPSLDEVWLENGRFVTEASTALAVRVLDIKERDDSRYLICDGGRTNQALAADHGAHRLLVVPARTGRARLTTVCGPTCMTDDVLARVPLPQDIIVGDVIAWMDAGAYHLPWETRFSHGLCAVAWCDETETLQLAREREHPAQWATRWTTVAT